MTTAVFAGSFDPPTYGHLNIIQRASSLFDRVDVLVAVNSEKKYMFSNKERVEFLKEITASFDNVCVNEWDGLVVEYCRKSGASILIRGIRNASDFDYEFDLSLLNKSLNPMVETVFIPTEQKYGLIRSSSIKEVARLGGDISSMVPPVVEKAIKERFKK